MLAQRHHASLSPHQLQCAASRGTYARVCVAVMRGVRDLAGGAVAGLVLGAYGALAAQCLRVVSGENLKKSALYALYHEKTNTEDF